MEQDRPDALFFKEFQISHNFFKMIPQKPFPAGHKDSFPTKLLSVFFKVEFGIWVQAFFLYLKGLIEQKRLF